MAVAPSRVNFNNVTSMGVSYDWSHGQGGAVVPCPGITNQEGRANDWIERVKTVDLEVANLDLSNAGGSVIAGMATQQDKYVNTATHSIYANGLYAGNGYLTSYSINEGSMSNASSTNLSYTMRDGGEDPNEADDADNPVTRAESIKVSRDIKGKSYSIDHSYSVSYGSDFDLVTDFPLYKDKPQYKSVDGRLALAEQEAQSAVNNDITNYGDYIDLSLYTLGNGFDLRKINNGCSGVFTTSSETKNFINGDYSYNKNTILRYTGENLDTDIDPYEINYSIAWDQKSNVDDAGDCVILRFKGNITANEGTVQDCSTEAGGAGAVAESGFKEWVTGPTAKGITKVKEFYNAIKNELAVPNADNYPLIDEILSYRKKECAPSVDKGGNNDGTIEFEFEMSTCPEQNVGDTQYEFEQSTSISFSKGGCKGAERRVTEISIDGSVKGNCGQSLGPDGNYPRWESVSGVFTDLKGSGLDSGPEKYEGSFNLRLASEKTSINQYDGNGSYTYTWTDAPLDKNCEAPSTDGCDTNFGVSIKTTNTPSITRYVNTITAIGPVSEIKGKTVARKSTSIKIKSKVSGEAFPLTVNSVMTEAKCQINKNKPACIIDNISMQITKNQNQGEDQISASVTVAGIEDVP